MTRLARRAAPAGTTPGALSAGARAGGPSRTDAAPPPRAAHIEREWSLKRNCCVQPRQFVRIVGGLLGLLAAVAAAGWAVGLPFVSAFCLPEMVLVAYAGVAYARHARDGERLTLLADGRLILEIQDGPRLVRHELNRHWSRIVRARHPRDSLWLHYGKLRVRLGRHVPPARRARFEAEFRRALRQPAAAPGGTAR